MIICTDSKGPLGILVCSATMRCRSPGHRWRLRSAPGGVARPQARRPSCAGEAARHRTGRQSDKKPPYCAQMLSFLSPTTPLRAPRKRSNINTSLRRARHPIQAAGSNSSLPEMVSRGVRVSVSPTSRPRLSCQSISYGACRL